MSSSSFLHDLAQNLSLSPACITVTHSQMLRMNDWMHEVGEGLVESLVDSLEDYSAVTRTHDLFSVRPYSLASSSFTFVCPKAGLIDTQILSLVTILESI